MTTVKAPAVASEPTYRNIEKSHRRRLQAENQGLRFPGSKRWLSRASGTFQTVLMLRRDIRQQSSVDGSGSRRKDLTASPMVTSVCSFRRQRVMVMRMILATFVAMTQYKMVRLNWTLHLKGTISLRQSACSLVQKTWVSNGHQGYMRQGLKGRILSYIRIRDHHYMAG